MKIKFFIEVFSSDIRDDTHAISICSGLQLQCEAYSLLRTVVKQFSVNAKDLVTYLSYQPSQYAAFDHLNETDVMIITLRKSVTRAI